MKIITEDAIYIQNKDLLFLERMNTIKNSISNKLFSNYNLSDDLDSFIKYDDPEIILYLDNLDFIVSYNTFQQLSNEEIVKYLNMIMDEHDTFVEIYNLMSMEEKLKDLSYIKKCEKLTHKYNSLRDILWYKQGFINLDIPTENRFR